MTLDELSKEIGIELSEELDMETLNNLNCLMLTRLSTIETNEDLSFYQRIIDTLCSYYKNDISFYKFYCRWFVMSYHESHAIENSYNFDDYYEDKQKLEAIFNGVIDNSITFKEYKKAVAFIAGKLSGCLDPKNLHIIMDRLNSLNVIKEDVMVNSKR